MARTTLILTAILTAACARPAPPRPPRPLTDAERAAGIRIRQYEDGKGTPASTFSRVYASGLSVEKLQKYMTAYFTMQGKGGTEVKGIARSPMPEVLVEDATSNHLRLVVQGARREVLVEKNYWELLYLDFWLTKIGKPLTEQQQGKFSGDKAVLTMPLPKRTPVHEAYDVALVVSGRFAAGGKPDSVIGYSNEFIAAGFGPELEFYATRTLQRIAHYFYADRHYQ